jgi:Transposase, Mutator family
VYVWADGVYLQARMEAAAECMLVLIGAIPEGKKELVGFQTGVRESAQSWRELLIDIKQRGLEIAPDLAVGDGALGFWKAIEEVSPHPRQIDFIGRLDLVVTRRIEGRQNNLARLAVALAMPPEPPMCARPSPLPVAVAVAEPLPEPVALATAM